jgi:predicted ATP-grasp superfamily ATP-dependent carboligase
MLQEIIPGKDTDVVNYNAYFHGGEPCVEFTAQHIRNAPPLWGSPRVAMSKKVPEVLEPGRKILRAMSFSGYACTEFKRSRRRIQTYGSERSAQSVYAPRSSMQH